MEYTYSDLLFSDLHKDAFGYRPRSHEYYEASPERKQMIWDQTVLALEDSMYEEELLKKMRLKRREQSLQAIRQVGAPDEETALRWYAQSLGVTVEDVEYVE